MGCFKRKWRNCIIMTIMFAFYTLLFKVGWKHFETNRKKLSKLRNLTMYKTQEYTCPLCFGKSLCSKFHPGELLPSVHKGYGISEDSYTNVYFAKMKFGEEWEKVVLKRLAHDSELKSYEPEIKSIIRKDLLKHDVIVENGQARRLSFTTCPSKRLVKLAKTKFVGKSFDEELTFEETQNFLTTVLLNPEPIYAQLFKSEDGWPFPKYYGACGRFVVEKFEGLTLENHCNDKWQSRVYYAYQLMEIAKLLMNNSAGYSLYFDDATLVNFVVDENDKVKFIDGEDLFVVDNSDIPKDAPFYITRYIKDCEHPCVLLDTRAMCKQNVLDHNYFALCEQLFASYSRCYNIKSGGFLHGIPPEIDEKWKVYDLIDKCLTIRFPPMAAEIAQNLTNTLKQMHDMYHD